MPVIKHLYVDHFGCFIRKHSERLLVTCKGETMMQAPLLFLESVVIANQGVSISAEMVRECTERGIPIFFLSGTGTPYASLYSAGLTGTIATRRCQLEGFQNGRGLCLALSFASGKLQNQSNLLKYFAKYRKENDPALYDEIICCALEVLDHLEELQKIEQAITHAEGSDSLEEMRSTLMGNEGRAARRYWDAVKHILPDKLEFPGRVGRGAGDVVNASLNYCYGILYSACERCLVLAGLDPYAGFLHADRPGKPSLTLDFIEEFRQPAADRAVISMANKNMPLEQDEHGRLTKETRHLLVEQVNKRLDSRVAYHGKQHPLRNVMQMQARRMAAYLRDDRGDYSPFVMEW